MTNPNDCPPLYKFVVLTHAGAFKHDLVLDGLGTLATGQQALRLADGPVLEVRPGGDCRQASFSGVSSHLGIGYEDLVEVWWSEDGGATWQARWSGSADTVPALRHPDADGYVLYGLRQRLDRVEVRETIPQDFPNRQWAQMLTAVIASGQLGQAVKVPQLPSIGIGTPRPAIVPRYESPMQIADKWLTADLEDASAGIGDYGVNAQRQPIWGKPDGLHIFDERDGVIIQGQRGSSAKLRTHVRATWNRPGPGPYEVFGQSLLGQQEGAQTTLLVQVADPAVYGHSSRRELLKPLPQYFTRAPCIGVSADWTPGAGTRAPVVVGGQATLVPLAPWAAVGFHGDLNSLNDGDVNTALAVYGPPTVQDPHTGQLVTAQGGTFLVRVKYPPGPVPWGVAVHVLGGIVTGFLFDDVLDVRCPPEPDGLLLFPDEVRQWIADHWDSGALSEVAVRVARTGTGPIYLTTLGMLFMDEAAVKRDVMRLAHLPTPEPETIRVPGWNVAPRAFVTCIYRAPDGSEEGRSEARRADLYRYVIDEDGQAWTEVQVGQADDADDVAQAAQAERRVQQAALSNAVSAR
ncbi:hypothetical protein K7W42_19420 [Deinococcus sp. HMF7604]|uniref:hypothetical protein n=1 Tax=Deinococcus betulae TaxID=2873312 RepID=UPI001CCAC5EA|nr:hypothetical protein [Deinococcus betulae]MBZ9753012.1 hypothetical protein [Deinococcus betulae]